MGQHEIHLRKMQKGIRRKAEKVSFLWKKLKVVLTEQEQKELQKTK